ncbi:hypothetical protein MAR_004253 [Mya arenaria]|uniref:Uncharacterized protein n=1 Tax=Mya arenaria TaxID=6604 RepID=A0ABY7EW23_MYAAR|nr:hypothetical protein MAR_004253 [Mya arenaria]
MFYKLVVSHKALFMCQKSIKLLRTCLEAILNPTHPKNMAGFYIVMGLVLVASIIVNIAKSRNPAPHNHLLSTLAGISMRTQKHRFWKLLCGDIESNPGLTGNAHIYPCGLCDIPVTLDHKEALCCDGCDNWHHPAHSHDTNISFELSTTNCYNPLSHIDSSIDSFTSGSVFSPLHISSPVNTLDRFQRFPSSTKPDAASLFNISEKKNLRIMNINCRSIRGGKSTDFKEVLEYI